MNQLHSTWQGLKYYMTIFIILPKCVTFQVWATTNFTFFKDCAHTMSHEGLHPSRTTWCSIEDIFQTIDHITRSEEWYRAFFNLNLETSKPVIQVNKVSYGKDIWQYKSDHPIMVNPTQHGLTILPWKTIDIHGVHLGKAQDNKPINMVLKR